MYEHGTVNHQITDSVTQVDTGVVGNAPAQTTAMLDAVMAESIGMAMYNAVTAQHNAQMVSSAAVAAACARMLKSPGALPQPALPVFAAPVVNSVHPSPIPVNSNTQKVHIHGSNFQPGAAVDLFDALGTQIGTLAGSQQIGKKETSTSLVMKTNLFSAPGTYGIEVVNPNGTRSARYPVIVTAFPTISSVTAATQPGSYTVSGKNFQSHATVSVFDQSGDQLAGSDVITSPVSVATITNPASLLALTIVSGSPAGPYTIQVQNPDGGTSNIFNMGKHGEPGGGNTPGD